MDEVEREHCSGRFQVDRNIENNSFISLSFHQKQIFFFASLPVYVIPSVHNMLFFVPLTTKNGVVII